MQSTCVLNTDQNIYLKSINWTDSMKSSAWTNVEQNANRLMIILITFIIIH